MGRVFDDEDEAKMIKLTESLTAWINKYASKFDDPEHLLFEVTSSLLTEEMINELSEIPEIVSTKDVQTEDLTQQTTQVTISFTYSDNNDWFVFEQTSFVQEGDSLAFEFGFDNIWDHKTQDLASFDDWGMLSDEEWKQLID